MRPLTVRSSLRSLLQIGSLAREMSLLLDVRPYSSATEAPLAIVVAPHAGSAAPVADVGNRTDLARRTSRLPLFLRGLTLAAHSEP